MMCAKNPLCQFKPFVIEWNISLICSSAVTYLTIPQKFICSTVVTSKLMYTVCGEVDVFYPWFWNTVIFDVYI